MGISKLIKKLVGGQEVSLAVFPFNLTFHPPHFSHFLIIIYWRWMNVRDGKTDPVNLSTALSFFTFLSSSWSRGQLTIRCNLTARLTVEKKEDYCLAVSGGYIRSFFLRGRQKLSLLRWKRTASRKKG